MRDHLGNFILSSNMGFAKGVQLLDDCEGTFNYIAAGDGADFVAEYATAAAFNGTKGIHLATRTTDPAEDDNVSISKWFGYPSTGRLVIRGRIMMPDISDIKSIIFELRANSGAYEKVAHIEWTVNTPLVEVVTDAGGQALTTLAYKTQDLHWQPFEIQLDLDSQEYLSVELFGIREEIVDESFYDSGAQAWRGAKLTIAVIAAGAAIATVYLDNLYVGEFENV